MLNLVLILHLGHAINAGLHLQTRNVHLQIQIRVSHLRLKFQITTIVASLRSVLIAVT